MTGRRGDALAAHPPATRIEITFGAGIDGDTPVYLRETSAPDTVVTTTCSKWDAFIRGVLAREFDHLVAGTPAPVD